MFWFLGCTLIFLPVIIIIISLTLPQVPSSFPIEIAIVGYVYAVIPVALGPGISILHLLNLFVERALHSFEIQNVWLKIR